MIHKQAEKKNNNSTSTNNCYRLLVFIFIFLSFFGLFFVRFNNDHETNNQHQSRPDIIATIIVEPIVPFIPSSSSSSSSSSSHENVISININKASHHQFINKIDRMIWTPTACGSLWNMSNYPANLNHFAELDAVKFNVRKGRKVVADAQYNITENDHCVSYDRGKFISSRSQINSFLSSAKEIMREDILSKSTLATVVEIPEEGPRKFEIRRRTELPTVWKHIRPKIYLIHHHHESATRASRRLQNVTLPRIKPKHILGFNLASYIAKHITIGQASSSS